MRELGIEAGPALGRLMRALDEAIGAGEVTSQADALALARRLREEDA
jgi:hypothetical protein